MTDHIQNTPFETIPLPADGGNREALGLFDDMESLQTAIRELENTAFPRDSISILGTRHDLEHSFGSAQIEPYLAEDDPAAPREPAMHALQRAPVVR